MTGPTVPTSHTFHRPVHIAYHCVLATVLIQCNGRLYISRLEQRSEHWHVRRANCGYKRDRTTHVKSRVQGKLLGLWWLLHTLNEASIIWPKNCTFQSTHKTLSSISHYISYYFNWTQYWMGSVWINLTTGRSVLIKDLKPALNENVGSEESLLY